MMYSQAIGVALLCLAWLGEGKVSRVAKRPCLRRGYNGTIYEYEAPDLKNGKVVPLSNYKDKFGLQEPGQNASEILNGVRYVRPGNNFEPNFDIFAKVEVNGEHEHPLFTYLKDHCPATRDGFSNKHDLFYHPFKNWDIRWNWEKFLVDRSGKPYMRYDPSSEPLEHISNDIEALLGSGHH